MSVSLCICFLTASLFTENVRKNIDRESNVITGAKQHSLIAHAIYSNCDSSSQKDVKEKHVNTSLSPTLKISTHKKFKCCGWKMFNCCLRDLDKKWREKT